MSLSVLFMLMFVFLSTCLSISVELFVSLSSVSLSLCLSLQLISEEIATLQHNHATTMAKLAQFKRKHQELSHRVLEVKSAHEAVGVILTPSLQLAVR